MVYSNNSRHGGREYHLRATADSKRLAQASTGLVKVPRTAGCEGHSMANDYRGRRDRNLRKDHNLRMGHTFFWNLVLLDVHERKNKILFSKFLQIKFYFIIYFFEFRS